jgi:hypothetical protein
MGTLEEHVQRMLGVSPTRAAFEGLGYSSDEAEALLTSGFVVVDLDAEELAQRMAIITSEPVNLVALDFKPDAYRPVRKEIAQSKVLFDVYTGAMLAPAQLTEAALYGGGGLAGRVLDRPRPVRFGRARFNAIPYYLASDLEGLRCLVQSLARLHGYSKLLLRGQTREYCIQRDPAVKRFLYGFRQSPEPSLLTNAFRTSFDYTAAEPYARTIILELLARLCGIENRSYWVESEHESLSVAPETYTPPSETLLAMALGQHYGIPTYGLDVTGTLEIAWWFATHRLRTQGDKCRYEICHWGHLQPDEWPIIYIFEPRRGVDIRIEGVPSTRITAQDGRFLLGGWGLHGNVCQRDVIAAITLAPDVGASTRAVEEVFPPANSDPVFKELLWYKKHVRAIPAVRESGLLDYIFELAYE